MNGTIIGDLLVDLFGADVFWLAVGSLGAVITLSMIYYQIRISRSIAAADFLLRLENVFYSKRMLKNRREIMAAVKHDPRDFETIDATRDVLDFFDDVGVLLKQKVISLELVWSAYCYWILRYWKACQGYVCWLREVESDSTYYDGFEYLFQQMLRAEEKKRGKKADVTDQELREFIDEEMKL
jgi:hypothetical protein